MTLFLTLSFCLLCMLLYLLYCIYCIVFVYLLFCWVLFSGRCDVTPLPGESPTISQPWGRECLNIGNVFHRIGHIFIQGFDLIVFVLFPPN